MAANAERDSGLEGDGSFSGDEAIRQAYADIRDPDGPFASVKLVADKGDDGQTEVRAQMVPQALVGEFTDDGLVRDHHLRKA